MQILRLLKIFFVFIRFGIDEITLSGFKHRGIRFLVRTITIGRQLSDPRGKRIRLALESLGPIFIKFGQVLSTRRDLLPVDIANELSKLQDQVPAFSSAIAENIIEKSLGQPIKKLFTEFEPIPAASASVSQVHFATIKKGEHAQKAVAIKVLRPGILPIINSDLALLKQLAKLVERWWIDGKRLRAVEVVAEFDKYLHDELDLMREAANASQLRRNFANSDLLMVPEIFWDYCSPTILVMERMTGVPINQIENLKEANIDFKKLAREGIEIFFTQVFRDGFFHADMHPGNIQVSIHEKSFGRYIALDFGIIGSLSDYDKNYLAQNLLAFFNRDYHRVAALHIESGWVPINTRVEELEGAVRAVCEPYFDRPLKDISLGQVLLRLFQTSRRFHVEIQPQLVLLQKTLLNVEGLGRELDPDLDLWKTAKPYLERWMSEQIGWRRLIQQLKTEAPYWSKSLPEMPRLIHQSLTALHTHPKSELLVMLNKLNIEQQKTNRIFKYFICTYITITTITVAGIAYLFFA